VDQPEISVVVPAYNEEGNIPLLIANIEKSLSKYDGYEILIVDDGSSDGTLDLLRAASKRDSRIRYVRFSRNFGHQPALRAGLEHARGKAVISMDADHQHPVALLDQLISHWKSGYSIVTTVRQDSASLPPLKRWTSNTYYRILNWLSDVKVTPGSADFRLLDQSAVRALADMEESDLVFRTVIPWLGFKSIEVPYKPNDRFSGNTKYSYRRMMSFAVSGVLSNSIKPLRLAGLTLIYVTYAVVRFFVWGNTIPGWASTVISVNLIGSLQLLVLGVIGEYLGRVLRETRRRPAYIVAEMS
jgi:polyisoprenyl-phosphate glycosyltransferase